MKSNCNWRLMSLFLLGAIYVNLCGVIAFAASDFEQIVSKANASDGVIRMGLEGIPPELIRAWEAGWKKEFGFRLRLETEPGHRQREIPIKVMHAARIGRGIIDIWTGGIPNALRMFKKGVLASPPWQTLAERWPLLKVARDALPRITGGPDGTVLSDYCIQTNIPANWTIVYNTKLVKPEEVKNIKWEDLAAEKWRNRLGWDTRAAGLYAMPFAPGWNIERARVLAHNLGANGVKLLPGGSNGVRQALIQGEIAIGFSPIGSVIREMNLGAPIGVAFPDFLIGNIRILCMTEPRAGDPDMASLFWAWFAFEGAYIEGKLTGSGPVRFYPGEEGKLPIADLLRKKGYTDKRVAGARTQEQNELIPKYRKILIEALKEGIRTGKKIPH